MFSDSYPCLFYEKYFVMRNNLLLNTSDKEFHVLCFSLVLILMEMDMSAWPLYERTVNGKH